jgi:hypothetical protein
MSIVLQLEGVIDCPFSVGLDYVEEFIAARCTRGEALFRLPLLGGSIPLPTTACVAARPDLSEPGKPHDELAISAVTPGRVLGRIDLCVRFRIVRLRTRILLDAHYTPRFGRVGALLDHAFGRRVLERVLCDLLARISRAAEERERSYRIRSDARKHSDCGAARDGALL